MEERFDASIFIITRDNEYICLNEYKREIDGDGVFICLTDARLDSEYGNDNSICIYRRWNAKTDDALAFFTADERKRYLGERDKQSKGETVSAMWQVNEIMIPGNEEYRCEDYVHLFHPENFLDGYRSCRNIMECLRPLLGGIRMESCIPAIMLAYHTSIHFNGITCHGYIPSIGQWKYITENIVDINTAMHKIQGERFPVMKGWLDKAWWSSTECANGKAAAINHEVLSEYPKTSRHRFNILSLYAL